MLSHKRIIYKPIKLNSGYFSEITEKQSFLARLQFRGKAAVKM